MGSVPSAALGRGRGMRWDQSDRRAGSQNWRGSAPRRNARSPRGLFRESLVVRKASFHSSLATEEKSPTSAMYGVIATAMFYRMPHTPGAARIGLTVLLGLVCANCATYTNIKTARALDPGTFQFNAAAGAHRAGSTRSYTPSGEIGARYGVASGFDIGLTVTTFAVEA